MIRPFTLIAMIALAAVWPATFASAQIGLGIHFGDDHDDEHHHGHHDDHDDRHSDGFGIHIDDDHHLDHGHHHVDRFDHRHHSDWDFVVPHYDHHHHGSYYWDDGINYYVPRPYVNERRAYVAARPLAIEFGGYAHVDDLAGRLERQANELCLDLHHNYRHNAGFSETYREAYQILSTAKYIHAKEHQGDRTEVALRVDELDGLFHHVQGDIEGWSRRHRRQIGQSGLQAKLALVEATLHHLMNDVGVQGTHGPVEAEPAPAVTDVAPPPAS